MATIVANTGAQGNWTDGASWVGGSAPTAADDAQITVLTTTITINSGAVCRSADFTGFTGVCTHNAGVAFTIGDATAGLGNIALTLVSGMTYTLNNATTSSLAFVSTSSTQQTIAFGTKTIGAINIAGTGANYAFTSNMVSGGNFTHTLGTIHVDGAADNSGLTHSCARYLLAGSSAKNYTGGTSIMILNGAVSPQWDLSSGSGLTFTANTCILRFTASSSGFSHGSKTYYGLEWLGGGISNFGSGNFVCTNLTVTGTAVKTDLFSMGSNATVAGTLTLTGNSATNRLLVQSSTLGTARNLSAATNAITNADFRDITALGAASWNLAAISGGSGNCGGNTNITFTTAATKYWIGNGGNWSDPTNHWATSSNGSPNVANLPLPQDDVVFDANSFSSGSQTVTSDMPRVGKSINWTGVTNSPTSSITVARTVYGSSTLVSGMTYTDTAGTTFEGRGSFTLTSAGKTFISPIIQMVGGTLTFQDAFVATGTVTLNNGTLNDGGFTVSIPAFSSSNANTRVITKSGTWTLTGTGTIWTTATATNLTVTDTGTILITDTSSTSKTFSGGGKTYNNLTITGSGTGSVDFVGANTFNVFTINAPKTVRFTAATTTVFTSLIAVGTTGNVITISSITAATHTLSKASGKNVSNFLSLTNSIATGGAVWYAGKNSTNVSGNTGWIFGIPPKRQVVMSG